MPIDPLGFSADVFENQKLSEFGLQNLAKKRRFICVEARTIVTCAEDDVDFQACVSCRVARDDRTRDP
jgi:hypothetical protein